MEFILETQERSVYILNVSKVKGHLTDGIVEVFDNHQALIGLIDNNLIEVQVGGENEDKKFFVLQDGTFSVSDPFTPVGIEAGVRIEKTPTTVFVYAKNFVEIDKNTSVEYFSKKCKQIEEELDPEVFKIRDKKFESIKLFVVNFNARLLKKELDFYRSIIQTCEKIKFNAF